MTEDEMVAWLYRLNRHEFEQAPGVGDGQGSLECCSAWGHKELDTTERLNRTGLPVRYTLNRLWNWIYRYQEVETSQEAIEVATNLSSQGTSTGCKSKYSRLELFCQTSSSYDFDLCLWLCRFETGLALTTSF